MHLKVIKPKAGEICFDCYLTCVLCKQRLCLAVRHRWQTCKHSLSAKCFYSSLICTELLLFCWQWVIFSAIKLYLLLHTEFECFHHEMNRNVNLNGTVNNHIIMLRYISIGYVNKMDFNIITLKQHNETYTAVWLWPLCQNISCVPNPYILILYNI